MHKAINLYANIEMNFPYTSSLNQKFQNLYFYDLIIQEETSINLGVYIDNLKKEHASAFHTFSNNSINDIKVKCF